MLQVPGLVSGFLAGCCITIQMGYHGISVSHADNLVTFQHLSTTSQSGSQNVAIAEYELANQWQHWQQFHGYKI